VREIEIDKWQTRTVGIACSGNFATLAAIRRASRVSWLPLAQTGIFVDASVDFRTAIFEGQMKLTVL
jgi:hypothetical protein